MPQHDCVRAMMSFVRKIGIVVACVAGIDYGLAAGRAIEDIRISRQGPVVTADFAFPCQVRYLSHTPHGTGASFQVRLSLEEGCSTEIGSGLRSELYQPQGRDIADIHEVAFHTGAANQAMLTVSFDTATTVELSQGLSRNVIRLVTEPERRRLTEVPSSAAPSTPAPADIPLPEPAVAPALPQAEATPGPATPEPEAAVPEREPLRLVQPVPFEPADRFVVQVSTEPADSAGLALPEGAEDRTLYVNEVTAGTRRWGELRIGFFDSEREARMMLDRLIGDFPSAVVAIADVDEQARAHADPLVTPRKTTSTVSASPARAPFADAAESFTEDQAVRLAEEARGALLSQDYDRAIQIYTRLLEDPAYEARGEARELLGVARERNGQLAHARTEYQAYLAEFPDGADARRVRQRLAGLVTALDPPPAQVLRAAPEAESRGWDFSGGLSQYFRRDVIQLREDEREILGQSGLKSRVDFVARRQGERFDLLGRANAGYYYDMRSDVASEDQGLISNAYLEIADRELDLRTIVGRQSLYRSGVLGRFDGAHVSYQWRPDIALNLTTGFPVDSPRHMANPDHHFYSMSADLDDLVGTWDFSFFGHLQRIDGIADREAIGGEAHWRDERWNLVGSIDLDLSYEVLNSALFIANWRASDQLTLNGRLNVRAAPFLTTRNALIGQPVETMSDLQLLFTEPQIRRLARNRTAQAQSASVGLSMPVSQRFHFNGDLTYTETDATVGSGGVDIVPATGPQYFYSASFVGSSLFESGDTVIFGFRHVESLEALITALTFDLRYPMGSRLRLHPRIRLSIRDRQRDNTQQWIASPMLRVIYRWGRRHRLEAEVGGQWSDRDLPSPDPLIPATTEKSSASFFNLGYWMEF